MRRYGIPPEVRAGGGIVWRKTPGTGSKQDGPKSAKSKVKPKATDYEVVLVHHNLHRDWSLPKGKQDPGEDTEQCAVREVFEETGLKCKADDHIAVVHYVDRIGRTKLVHYWSMHAGDPTIHKALSPSLEIDEARWVPLAQALAEVSLGRDRMVLWAFASFVGIAAVDLGFNGSLPATSSPPNAAMLEKAPVLLLRHASAGDRFSWSGDDSLRELDSKGSAQAKAIHTRIGAFPVTRIISSPATRCVESVEPFAKMRGIEVEIEPRLSEGAGEGIADLLADYRHKGVLVSTHGDVIEEALRRLAASGIPLPGDGDVRKGSCWVLNGNVPDNGKGASFRIAAYLPPPTRATA